MKNLTPIERLHEYIMQARQDLERYASKPQASEVAIGMKNRSLAELTEIYNSLSVNDLSCVCYWQKAELFLNAVIEDAQIGSIYLILKLRDKGLPATLILNEL